MNRTLPSHSVRKIRLRVRLRVLLKVFAGLSLWWGMGPARAFDWVPDGKVTLLGRSYPVGVQVQGSASIGVPLWGKTDTWKYGYARLSMNGATSVVVNRVGVEAQVYPVSILGIAAGFESGNRQFTPKFLNADEVESRGRVDRAYVRGQFLVGARGVVLMVNVRSEVLHSYGSGKPFFDEMTLLRGRNFGESILIWNPVLLYRLDPAWSVGALSLYSRALDSGGFAHMAGPVVSYSDQKSWNLVAGIGANRSPLVNPGVTLFFSSQWTLAPSLQINDLPIRKDVYSSLF